VHKAQSFCGSFSHLKVAAAAKLFNSCTLQHL